MRLHYVLWARTIAGQTEGSQAMLLSTVTERGQTTLPKGVRAALDIGPHDRIAYIVEQHRAIIAKAEAFETEEDPALSSFLSFIQHDISQHPEHIRELPQALLDRMDDLLGHADIDLDAPIEGEVAI